MSNSAKAKLKEDIDDYRDDLSDRCDEEEASIQQLRQQEVSKNIFKKDEQRITTFLQQKRVSELERELLMKDKEIQKLTQLVKI